MVVDVVVAEGVTEIEMAGALMVEEEAVVETHLEEADVVPIMIMITVTIMDMVVIVEAEVPTGVEGEVEVRTVVVVVVGEGEVHTVAVVGIVEGEVRIEEVVIMAAEVGIMIVAGAEVVEVDEAVTNRSGLSL